MRTMTKTSWAATKHASQVLPASLLLRLSSWKLEITWRVNVRLWFILLSAMLQVYVPVSVAVTGVMVTIVPPSSPSSEIVILGLSVSLKVPTNSWSYLASAPGTFDHSIWKKGIESECEWLKHNHQHLSATQTVDLTGHGHLPASRSHQMASCAHEVWLVRAGYLFFSVEIFLPTIKIVLRRLSYFKSGFANSYVKDCDWRSKDFNEIWPNSGWPNTNPCQSPTLHLSSLPSTKLLGLALLRSFLFYFRKCNSYLGINILIICGPCHGHGHHDAGDQHSPHQWDVSISPQHWSLITK